MNVPQIVLPSLLYLHYKKRRGFVYGFTGMLFAWLLIAELRASPQLSNIFAVESSLPLSLSVNSLLHLSSLPTAVTLFILFAGSLSLLHFIFARHLLTLVISGVAVLVLGIPIKAASHSASATDVYSAITILQTGFSNLETVYDRFQLEVGNAVEYILGTLIQQVTPAAELLLLPETVIRTTEGTRMLQDITRGHPTTIIGGAFTTTDPTSAKGFNSAILVNNGEATEIFHKWQLIPFYESSVFH